MNNRGTGALGETLAVAYMQQQGMRVIHRNYTCKAGELDILAYDGDYLAVVEVKARYGGNMGYPLEAVTPAKITQIVKATRWYLTVNHLQCDVRFDIACVDLTNEIVEYVRNAFTQADAGRKNHW